MSHFCKSLRPGVGEGDINPGFACGLVRDHAGPTSSQSGRAEPSSGRKESGLALRPRPLNDGHGIGFGGWRIENQTELEDRRRRVVTPAEVSLESATVIAPPASNNAAVMPSANLSFIQVITLSVPFTRARVEAATAGPLITVAVMVVANPMGAAWAELAEMAPAMMAVVEETPYLEK